MIVFDTNVVSELMKATRDPEVIDRIKQFADLDQRITAFTVYGAEEARITGLLLAATQARGIILSQPDAQIAGTCLTSEATLVTRNVSDFQHSRALRIVGPFPRLT